MDGVDKHLMMVHIIKDFGMMIQQMEKVYLYNQMVENIKDNLKMIKVMEKVNLYQQIKN